MPLYFEIVALVIAGNQCKISFEVWVFITAFETFRSLLNRKEFRKLFKSGGRIVLEKVQQGKLGKNFLLFRVKT